MKEVSRYPLRYARQETIVIFEREKNYDNENVENAIVRSRCSSSPELLFLVNETERHNRAGDCCTHVRAHDDRYRALNGNGIGSNQCHHHGRCGRAALNHGRNQQTDKKCRKRIRGSLNNCFRCRLADVLKRRHHQVKCKYEQHQRAKDVNGSL